MRLASIASVIAIATTSVDPADAMALRRYWWSILATCHRWFLSPCVVTTLFPHAIFSLNSFSYLHDLHLSPANAGATSTRSAVLVCKCKIDFRHTLTSYELILLLPPKYIRRRVYYFVEKRNKDEDNEGWPFQQWHMLSENNDMHPCHRFFPNQW